MSSSGQPRKTWRRSRRTSRPVICLSCVAKPAQARDRRARAGTCSRRPAVRSTADSRFPVDARRCHRRDRCRPTTPSSPSPMITSSSACTTSQDANDTHCYLPAIAEHTHTGRRMEADRAGAHGLRLLHPTAPPPALARNDSSAPGRTSTLHRGHAETIHTDEPLPAHHRQMTQKTPYACPRRCCTAHRRLEPCALTPHTGPVWGDAAERARRHSTDRCLDTSKDQ